MGLLVDWGGSLRRLLPILLILSVVSAEVVATAAINAPDGLSAFAVLKGTAITVVADICDNYGSFNCPTGTCYTGYDGFVGCCSAASCAARTACFSYDSKTLHSCNVDTDGCIACSSGAPACVTVSNVVNNQYIMYCDSSAAKVTLSYTNLITTGSMALPPMSKTASMAPITASSYSSSSPDPQSRVPTANPTTAAAASNATQTKDFQVSRGAVAGITLGSVIGLASIIFLLGFLYRRLRSFNEASESEKSSGLFEPDYPRSSPTEMVNPRRLQKRPTSRGGPMRDRLAIRSFGEDDSLSVGEILARDAEHRNDSFFPQGVSRSDYAPTSPADRYPSPAIGKRMRRGDWRPTPPVLPPDHQGPVAFRPYHTSSGVVEKDIAELPNSGIRYVHPSGSHSSPDLPSLTTANFGRDPHSSTQVEAASSTYSNPISPNPSSFVGTPFMMYVSPPMTPLMGRWENDRSSVGQINMSEDTSARQSQSEHPNVTSQSQLRDRNYDLAPEGVSARVTGPLNWPSGMHIQNQSNGQSRISRENDASSNRHLKTGNECGLVRNGAKRNRNERPVHDVPARSLTSATGFSSGAKGRYIGAEAAMAGADLAADKEFEP